MEYFVVFGVTFTLGILILYIHSKIEKFFAERKFKKYFGCSLKCKDNYKMWRILRVKVNSDLKLRAQNLQKFFEEEQTFLELNWNVIALNEEEFFSLMEKLSEINEKIKKEKSDFWKEQNFAKTYFSVPSTIKEALTFKL